MVSILMATYNGERYVGKQIQSILSQTYTDTLLYISDDKSTDGTYEILKGYAEKYPDKIFISQRAVNSGSPWKNFMELMVAQQDDYVMLCDQDDVWLPDKIQVTLEKLMEIERQVPTNTPVLVYTDLQVVDSELKVVSESFMEIMDADYSRTALNQLLMQNIMAGCTSMYNRALCGYLTAVPEYMVMHDWWLIMVASAFGKVAFLPQATILYRQHGNNQVGAHNVCTLSYKIGKLLSMNAMRVAVANTFRQADSFLQMYKDRLSYEQVYLLGEYTRIPTQCKIKRCLALCRMGSFKNGLSRKIATFLVV